jgi:hypothetical protein
MPLVRRCHAMLLPPLSPRLMIISVFDTFASPFIFAFISPMPFSPPCPLSDALFRRLRHFPDAAAATLIRLFDFHAARRLPPRRRHAILR